MPQAVNEFTDHKTGQTTRVEVPWTAEDLRVEVDERRKVASDAVIEDVAKRPIRTDKATRDSLLQAIIALQILPEETIHWQLPDDSWITLDLPTARDLFAVVWTHVQQSYDRQKELSDRLDANEDPELVAADLDKGWPTSKDEGGVKDAATAVKGSV